MTYDISPHARGVDWTSPKVRHVDPRTTPVLLLAGEGVFPLDEVCTVLKVPSAKYKAEADRIFRGGKDPFEEIGITCTKGDWIVKVSRFAPFYRSALRPRIRSVLKSWDGNDLIRQKGLFLLRDVCRLIPFTPPQLRYQAQKHPKGCEECGIWKDDVLNTYVVDMSVFGEWIARIWIEQVKSR